MKKTYTVDQLDANQRLDHLLKTILSPHSRTHIQKQIKQGNITVNNQPTKSSYLLKVNDHITIQESPRKRPPGGSPSLTPMNIPLEIIYEDEHTIAINKQHGMVSHPSIAHQNDSLLNALVAYQPQITQNFTDQLRIGLVHRLDKDTSGVILIAKSQDSLAFYTEQFENRAVEKQYIAIVKGDVRTYLTNRGMTKLTIQNHIVRSKYNRKKFTQITSTDKGKHAETLVQFDEYWERIEDKTETRYSRLNVWPKTGRTHQIRVHLTGLGFPIVGDPIYSSIPYDRMMLHAFALSLRKFDGVKNDEMLSLKATLPRLFQNAK